MAASFHLILQYLLNYVTNLNSLKDKVYLHKIAVMTKYFSYERIHKPG